MEGSGNVEKSPSAEPSGPVTDSSLLLTRAVFQKVMTTILEIETVMYETVVKQEPSTAVLRKDNCRNIFAVLAANRFNVEYDYLSKGDPSLFVKYAILRNIHDHSPLCLIHICFNLALTAHRNISRAKLDLSNKEKYVASVKEQLQFFFREEAAASFSGMFRHDCRGPRILEVLPPGTVLFTTSVPEVNEQLKEARQSSPK